MDLENIDLSTLDDGEKLNLIKMLEAKLYVLAREQLFHRFFPIDSKLSIDNYPKQKEFFRSGALTRQRLFIAGNRCGKTFSVLFEMCCHAIRWYPSWWTGKRYDPDDTILIWICGDTNKTIRDILQNTILGTKNYNDPAFIGTGILPKKYIEKVTAAGSVSGLVDTIYTTTTGKGRTEMQLKSYLSGRETFQGTAVHEIVLDEEPPLDIYVECLMRGMTVNGGVTLSFTPLRGLTQLIQKLYDLKKKDPNSITIVQAGWNHVPHLTEKDKEELRMSIPEYQREARENGIPSLGSGVVYPFNYEDVRADYIPKSKLPSNWLLGYGIDVGWNFTAVCYFAYDPEDKILYIYDVDKFEKMQPYEYAKIIKDKTYDWEIGVVDTGSLASSQMDGKKIFNELIKEGLKLEPANKAVEAGTTKCWQGFKLKRLQIMEMPKLELLMREFRIYQRKEDGTIDKKDDHLMDAMRYYVMSDYKNRLSIDKVQAEKMRNDYYHGGSSWMS